VNFENLSIFSELSSNMPSNCLGPSSILMTNAVIDSVRKNILLRHPVELNQTDTTITVFLCESKVTIHIYRIDCRRCFKVWGVQRWDANL